MRRYVIFIFFAAGISGFLMDGGDFYAFGQEQDLDTAEQAAAEQAPQKVIRKAVSASTLPIKPALRVPNYPDETQWYNTRDEVVVFWEVPDDVLQVSLRVSETPDEKAGVRQSELLNGKNLGHFEEGVWYVRAQFRNNKGWGPLGYYKIQIDRTAPEFSEVNLAQDGNDDPVPRIEFKVKDALSGIARVSVLVDGKEISEATSSPFHLPPQKPGAHTVSVVAVDSAGNRAEEFREIQIDPLPAPAVLFATRSLSEGDAVFISGNAPAQKTIMLTVYNNGGDEVLRAPTVSNMLGEWEMALKDSFSAGSYKILARSSDERGAISNFSEPVSFQVIPKSILSFGSIFYFGVFELLAFVLLLCIAAGGIAAWYRAARRKGNEVYGVIAERDVELITLLENDLDSIEEWIEKNPDMKSKEKAEVGYLFKKTRDTVKKVKAYLGKEFRKK